MSLDQSWHRKTRWCEICGHFTHGRKPLCTDHLFGMPYVQEVLLRIERRGIELNKTEIVDDSTIGREILTQIRFRNVVGVKRLQKDHQIPEDLIKTYVDLFIKLGLCEMFNKKGYVRVRAL